METKRTKMRNVCFTAWEHPRIDKGDDRVIYYVYGREKCPDTGKTHWQGFLQVKNALSLNAIKAIINDEDDETHIEKMRGTAKEASDYCKKDGKIHEYGEIRGGKQGDRNDLKRLKEGVKEGKTMKLMDEDINSATSIKFVENYSKYWGPVRKWKTIVIWYYGATEMGKSRDAFEEAGEDVYVCMETSQWWEGYDGQNNVIIDDFRADFSKFHYLLKLFDRYPMRVQIKGGSKQFVANKIWVTCPYHPSKVYKERNKEDIQQLLRRIDVIVKFTPDGRVTEKSMWGDGDVVVAIGNGNGSAGNTGSRTSES